MKLNYKSRLLSTTIFSALLAMSACSKDDNQQEEIVVEEYSQSESTEVSVDTDEEYASQEESTQSDAAYGSDQDEQQSPETYSIEETDTVSEQSEDMAQTEGSSEIDEIVVPNTEDAEKVHQQNKAMAVEGDADEIEASAEEFVYIVKPNDTLGKISKIIYKTPGMWKKLAEYNNIENPSKIFPGDVIKYKADETSSIYAASHSAPEAYSVKKGDTLSSISVEIYGSANYWRVLYRWNQGSITNPDLIMPEQSLKFYSKSELVSSSDMGIIRKGNMTAH